jgi:hypothetical protein
MVLSSSWHVGQSTWRSKSSVKTEHFKKKSKRGVEERLRVEELRA